MAPFKQVLNRFAANVFFALHLAFSLFVIFGAFTAIMSRGWLLAHVPAVLWTFSMNVADWTCPLTTWEHRCRRRAEQPYSGGYIRQYLQPILSPTGSPRRLEVVVAISALLWNVLLYVVIFRARAFC